MLRAALALLLGLPGRAREVELSKHLTFLASLPAVPCRDELAIMAESRFRDTGRAAEIGVFQGHFSRKNLKHWTGEYHMVDAWQFRSADGADKNFESALENDHNYQSAMNNTRFAAHRRTLHRNLSTEAASLFPDAHFDWLYVDALHTEAALSADLEAWWPKLRVGGLISGDDYGDERDTPYLPVDRMARYMLKQASWHERVTKQREHQIKHAHSIYQWGVVSAVQAFAAKKGAIAHITYINDCYLWPAWWMVKPPA